MDGHENEKMTDVLQERIAVEDDDEVTIVEVRPAKGGTDNGSVVTTIASSVPRVKQEIDDIVEVANANGQDVYGEGAKTDERNISGGSNRRALMYMR